MWRYVLPLAGLAVLVVFFYRGLQGNPSVIPSPLIGKPAPEFSLASVRDPNRQVQSRDFTGRMYVLNVWGTWCVGCRQEHDVLLAIARTNVIPIVGLNWKDDRALAIRWLDQLGDPYVDSAFDPEGRAAINWGVYGAPETFLVSADGQVLHKHIAPLTLEVWERDFLPKIRAPQGNAP
ncbi:MAG TPA: DsbE family thiol:disulfide interchange protein [Steroidobacteraceae bacterium]